VKSNRLERRIAIHVEHATRQFFKEEKQKSVLESEIKKERNHACRKKGNAFMQEYEQKTFRIYNI
jgi:hypothetical protein